MQVGDIVVFLHLPEYGKWSVAQVVGGYRYEISRQGNAVDGTPDYGHIRDVELITARRPVDPRTDGISDSLRRAMRPPMRMWNLDEHAQEIDQVVTMARTRG
jgi:hypothetical protein